ncbi:probable ATP-dependent RNA helicase Dbp73D [Cylas formicarius]|uniref:probable ATP-dependent RNA helicase Dbp73D n=1 Tax=Cylas formicarius TaxID=197179 RepID=UPI00295893F2|nr:probable ATP-dependent RNA helicase Dbp73D [Cylas formicarius]
MKNKKKVTQNLHKKICKMDLFVIHRHGEDHLTDSKQEQEQSNLAKFLGKIEYNQRNRKKQKEKSKIKAFERTARLRQIKREKLAKIVNVPENSGVDEFTDVSLTIENDLPPSQDVEKIIKFGHKEPLNDDFRILGVENFNKKEKVKWVLPQWISHPTLISADLKNLKTKISDLKVLDKHLRKLLKANGLVNMFPVQAQVIPWLLQSNNCIMFPRDLCVSAPTGSGKTLSFVLPIIQLLKEYSFKRLRALVILPTQDLARQVFKSFKIYSKGTTLDILLSVAQNSFQVEQKNLVTKNDAFGYVSKVDILVCTAGRLVSHLKDTEGFDLQFLEFLVIDEADRVLDSMQNDWLHHLENHIPHMGPSRILNQLTLKCRKPPQKLLFSATLSQDPEKLKQLSLFQPILFTSVCENSDVSSSAEVNSESFAGKYATPRELTEKYIETSVNLKPLVLYKLIRGENLKKTLIFTHSIECTHRLTILLKALFKDELLIKEISSQLQPKSREELIQNFSDGKIDLLICTDALARGIDLPDVQCVISYSAPKYLKTYIHRAGRTARAGAPGLVIIILHGSQLSKFKGLLREAGKTSIEQLTMPEDELTSLAEQYKESLAKLRETVEREDKIDVQKKKSAKRLKPAIKESQRKRINLGDQ